MTFHCIAILHKLSIDNKKKHDWVITDLGQHEYISKAEVLAELESNAVMICKAT